jgi:hypothetical protein
MRYTVAAMLLACFATTVQTEEWRLPSLDHWELAGRLLQSEGLRESVECSPDQHTALRQFRADPEIQKIFDVRAKMLKRRHFIATGTMLHSEEFRRQTRVELDGFIKHKLQAILLPEQLEALPTLALRDTFGTAPYKVFLDKEVQNECGFSAVEMVPEITKQREKVDTQSLEAAWTSCRKFVMASPPHTRGKAAFYFGPEKFPMVNIPEEELNALRQAALPWPPHDGGALAIIHNETLRRQLGISNSQLEALTALEDALDKARSSLPPPSPPGGVNEYSKRYFALSLRHREETDKVLTQPQRQQIGRLYAIGEFRRNPEQPLLRQNFVDYLMLAPDELSEARRTAVAERFSLEKKYRAYNKECFERLSETLEAEPKQRLMKVFAGVWE